MRPDKGGDPELFKEVTHAYVAIQCCPLVAHIQTRYEVLSDPEKRSLYDARGEAGLNEQGGMGGMDPQVKTASLNFIVLNLIWYVIRTSSVNYSVADLSSDKPDRLVGPVTIEFMVIDINLDSEMDSNELLFCHSHHFQTHAFLICDADGCRNPCICSHLMSASITCFRRPW